MAAKKRKTWWIVSTHVLTAGLAMPLLAGIVGALVVGGSGLQGLPAFGILLVIRAIGYIGGSYYSLNYLRKKAITEDWTGCITPSVISFAVLSIVGFIASAVQLEGSIVAIGLLAVFYGAIIAAFAKITAVGFRSFQSHASSVEQA